MVTRPITGGIIAAGLGSRLRRDGFAVAKPLVPVAGVPLIAGVIRNFLAAGIASLRIIVNDEERDCVDWVRSRFPELDVEFIVKTTASSLESFVAVAGLRPVRASRERLGLRPVRASRERLGLRVVRASRGRPGSLADDAMLVSTVDAWCRAEDFARFADAARRRPPDASVLAVTPLVADENPLWVDLDGRGRVTALGGGSGALVTAGVYLVSAEVRRTPPPPGLGRLREYLTWLWRSGAPLYGEVVETVVDVDRAEDVVLAETLALTARRS